MKKLRTIDIVLCGLFTAMIAVGAFIRITLPNDLHSAVRKMPLHFENIDFSITITIGVEENDFHSTMEEIFNRADRKLYMGKAHGRNQVVI